MILFIITVWLKLNTISLLISNDNFEKSEYYSTFKFVEKMRNLLESKQTDIISWINIIFGAGQKYQNAKKKDLLFKFILQY